MAWLLLALSTVALGSAAEAAPVAPVLPVVDLQLTGTVQEAPAAGGIGTGDTLAYEITVRNAGPDIVPAGALLLVLFVADTTSAERIEMEVSRFNGNGLRPAQGGVCGNGRQTVVQCTNLAPIEPDGQVSVQISHRHPEAVAGSLTFAAEASVVSTAATDPAPGNNGFRGPAYGFVNPPTTSTSSSTTMPSSSTDTSSTTTDTSSSSTSESSTTSTSTTSTTASTTTTTATSSTSSSSSTTSTTLATLPPTTASSIEPLSDPNAEASSPGQVPGEGDGTDEQLAGPVAGDDEGGPPYVLLGGLAVVLALLGGLGLAFYSHLNPDPPLVDIRQYGPSAGPVQAVEPAYPPPHRVPPPQHGGWSGGSAGDATSLIDTVGPAEPFRPAETHDAFGAGSWDQLEKPTRRF